MKVVTKEYDGAGNLTNDPTSQNPTATSAYDAENRMIAAKRMKLGPYQWAFYTYNGDGQRVRRKTLNYEIWQVYGFDGELLAEYPQTGPSVAVAQPQKEYGYRNGQLLVTAEPYANSAWNKPATQTDNHAPTTTANKAVNGDVDGALWNGSASATNYHQNSWWQVDLQSVQTIDNITVWGRTDCCPEMTSNFRVFVSDNPFTSYDFNATIAQPGVSNYPYSGFAGPASINVNRTGRYVRVQLAGTQYLVLGEVQVWSQAAKINWMVTDHLGTPRMIVDKTGSTAGISRRDYLPFGEEIFAGTGGRTTQQGYTAGDGLRQQFTSKERDIETSLDYFLARYYSSTQGRFTSADSFGGFVGNPQTLNRYAYVQNNPLKFIDPTGHLAAPASYDPARCFLFGGMGCNGEPMMQDPGGQGPTPQLSREEIDRQRQEWIDDGGQVEIINHTDRPPRAMQAGGADTTGAFWLGLEYLTGNGPRYREFGPDSYMTRGLRSSPDIDLLRQEFANITKPGLRKLGPGAATGRFGLGAEDGPFEALWDWSWPRQFVGSFTITITERPNGTALFEIDNYTHLKSALYQLPGVQPVEPTTMAPLSTKHQKYWWVEKAPPRRN